MANTSPLKTVGLSSTAQQSPTPTTSAKAHSVRFLTNQFHKKALLGLLVLDQLRKDADRRRLVGIANTSPLKTVGLSSTAQQSSTPITSVYFGRIDQPVN